MSEEVTGADAESERTGDLDAAAQRRAVRARYADIARDADGGSGCCEPGAGCDGAGDEAAEAADDYSATLGYTDEDVAAVADGANLGLGCGNPTAMAGLESGETVLDLGSGAGFDCFLAAREVGDEGSVIGVDMTPAMVERARENGERNDVDNVEFRLGEIEHLPVADATVDVVISNCVVNLSPDKPRVYREAYRVLRPGGRLSISDVVLTAPVPGELRGDPTSVASCVAGAAPREAVAAMIADAGFEGVSIALDADSDDIVGEWDDERELSEFVQSAQITATKPVDPASASSRSGIGGE